MLYEVAHIIKERFSFLWDLIEWGNAEVFALIHRRKMRDISNLLLEFDGRYVFKVARLADVEMMRLFFERQPKDAFKFFQPHGFDSKGIKKVVKNKSFMTFIVMEGEKMVGYFFMRSFVNGKTYKGYMVDFESRGKGVATEMGWVMNKIAEEMGLDMFKSISPENHASMAVTKKVNDIKVLKVLDNGDYLVQCFAINKK